MEKHRVIFQPSGETIEILEGATIMEAIRQAGVDFDFPCGGGKKCGKCRVRVLKGKTYSHDIEKEFLRGKETKEGIHLACFTEVHGDIEVDLLQINNHQHQILSSKEEKLIELSPRITKKYVKVKKANVGEAQSEWKRLIDSVFKNKTIDSTIGEAQILLSQVLPQMLRRNNYNLTVVIEGEEILAIEEGDTTKVIMGIAFDIGTTTIVGYLMDLTSGEEIQVVSTLNPQVKFGADVIARSNYAIQEEKGLETLNNAVVGAINQLITEATKKANCSREDIYVMTMVGNTCMHHLFLGLNPLYITTAPYVPTISEATVLNARYFPVTINRGGKILILPNVAGFVGADTVGVLLATEMDKSQDIKLMIDIGTNGEMALGNKNKILTCSAAAGPAFEGAQISSGMRGASGAIDHVFFEDTFKYTVIGDIEPVGICGSGLLDVVAGLLESGIIDKRGRFLSPDKITNPMGIALRERIIDQEGLRAFVVVGELETSHQRPIMVTQKDIRELQMAKGAIVTGIKILMEKYCIDIGNIKEVLLAGAFGNYLNPHSACTLGLIPKELEDRINMVGNAAGIGAKRALLSKTEYKRAINIADFTEHVELASHPGFSSIFANSMYFK